MQKYVQYVKELAKEKFHPQTGEVLLVQRMKLVTDVVVRVGLRFLRIKLMKEKLWLHKCKRNSCQHTWYTPVTLRNKTWARIKAFFGRVKELHHQCACEICGCKRIKTLKIIEREKE